MATVVSPSGCRWLATRSRLAPELYFLGPPPARRCQGVTVTVTLVLPDHITSDLREAVNLGIETAGVLLARAHHAASGNIRLLGRSLHWSPVEAYVERSPSSMLITSNGYVRALAAAERDGAIPIWLHTHPRGIPLPSSYDRRVDAAIADVFRIRSGSDFYGTVIAAPNGSGFALTGTLQKYGEEQGLVDRFWLVGDRWQLVPAFDAQLDIVTSGVFDRNVRAFGPAIQQTIGALRIAIVGTGGTGSAVAEQLVRLGARQLLLVDPDELTASNVTRVYGSRTNQVGTPKVEVVARHLKSLFPDVRCTTLYGMCTDKSIARRLADADLIFGCTDDNAGRLVLSRLSTYYLTPVLDLGVLISSSGEGILTGIDGRVTVMSPGAACLVCRGRVDLTRASAEAMTPGERERLAGEGYAPALGPVQPAVVTFTTMVASAATNEFLERLIGYGDVPRTSEILLRVHDRAISTNVATPRTTHYCHPDRSIWGTGDTTPLLGRTWIS